MHVFIDLDGIVADFVRGLMARYKKPWPYDTVRGEKAWDISQLWGMTWEDLERGLDRSFWSNLPKTAEADDVMSLASNLCGRQNLCFLSSPVRTLGCADGKRLWVEEHYPGVPLLLSCAAQGAAVPKHFLAHERAILIDDHSPNVDAFDLHGGEAFLFPRPWNRRHPQEPVALQQLAGFLSRYAVPLEAL